MSRVARIAAAVVLLSLVPAGAVHGQADQAPPPTFGLEPPPEYMVEPGPRNQSEELLAKASRTVGFCNVAASLLQLPEPDPRDPKDVQSFAQGYHIRTTVLDPASKVRDLGSKRPDAEVVVPQELVDAIAVERREMYRFLGSVSYAVELARTGAITADEEAERIRYYTLQLMNSPFTAADRTVAEAARVLCT